MDYKEDKEILEVIKDLIDIRIQETKPTDEKLKKVIKSVKAKFPKESNVFEIAEAQGNINNITFIDNIPTKVLYNKLPFYKLLCEKKIIEKYGQEIYNEIIKEYHLLD